MLFVKPGRLLTLLALAFPFAWPAGALAGPSGDTAFLQVRLDSLRLAVATPSNEPDSIVVAQAGGDEAIDDQRSRRRRLDALLEEYMRRPGVINLNGDITGIVQGTLGDGESIATATGSFDLFLATRLGDPTLIFVNLEAIGGNGPNENVFTLSPLNGDAGSTQSPDVVDRLRVLEAWAEFTAFGDAATVTAGKVDLTNYFDNNAVANDETSQFISGAFVNSAALPVPTNTPGVRARGVFRRTAFVQIGAASSDNSGNRIFDELFGIASIGFNLNFGEGRRGSYRVYGYVDGAAGDGKGAGFSLDQPVGGGLAVFGRWNRNERKLADSFGIRSAWSIGAQLESDAMKKRIRVGAAFGVTDGAVSLSDEQIFETYVRVRLNQWTYLSPHFQVVRNAGGTRDTYYIPGFRTQFDF